MPIISQITVPLCKLLDKNILWHQTDDQWMHPYKRKLPYWCMLVPNSLAQYYCNNKPVASGFCALTVQTEKKALAVVYVCTKQPSVSVGKRSVD